ncbi:MAG: hypothetical protein DCC71_18505, partial [Proteobacteria bacterium]
GGGAADRAAPAPGARAEGNVARWQSLAPAERDRLREHWRRFRALPPAERERLVRERAVAE